jgi:quercetin dioxygenase-like cupin family protein
MKALDIQAVQAFVLTADLKSFTRAAEALDTTQSVHHHPGPSFVYMLEGTAESAYGLDDIKRFYPGDHWSQPVDIPHRIARNPDTKIPRRFLVFTVNRPGEPSTVFP